MSVASEQHASGRSLFETLQTVSLHAVTLQENVIATTAKAAKAQLLSGMAHHMGRQNSLLTRGDENSKQSMYLRCYTTKCGIASTAVAVTANVASLFCAQQLATAS